MKKRSIALLLAVVMLVGVVAGGTLAWLYAQSIEVTNTFTVGDINVKLDEADLKEGTNDIFIKADGSETTVIADAKRVQTNSYQLIPGTTYPKDPKVTIEGNANNVDAYLFIKLEEGDTATYLEYTLKLDGWNEVSGVTNVWYREVPKSAEDQSWYLLEGNAVTVKDSITKTTMPTSNQILKWTAYAVQKDNLTVAEAWNVALTGNK